MADITKRKIKTLTGRVVGDKMDKTVSVHIKRRFKHPLYGKYITRTTRIHAHDEDNKAKVGDTVRISQTRPIAKTKFFKVIEIKTTNKL